jgi:PST family polysaccharide transporter
MDAQPLEKHEQPDDGLDFSDDIGDLKRKSFRGGMAFVATQSSQILLQMGWTIIMARLLTPSDFGHVAMVAPLAALLYVIGDMGLSQAVMQRRQLSYAQLANLFWLSLAVHAALFVVFLAVSPLVGMFYGKPEVAWIAAVYSGMFLIGSLGSVHSALQARRLQFARLGLIKLTAFILGAAAGVVSALTLHNYWALVIASVTTGIISVTLTWITTGWIPGRPNRQGDVRSILGFGGNVATTRIFDYMCANADTVMIGKVWGEVALGYYDRAYRLMVSPTNLITGPLGNLAPAVLSRLIETPDSYRRATLGLMRLVLLATIPGMTFAVILAPRLIPVAFGDMWDPAVPIFQAFGIAALLRFQMIMLEWLFVIEDRTAELRNWCIVRTILTVGAFAAGLPWGALGVAAAYAGTVLLLMSPIQVVWATRRSPVHMSDIAMTVLMFLPGTAMAIAAMLAISRWAGLGNVPTLLVCLPLSYGIVWATAFAYPAGRRSFQLGWNVVRSNLAKPATA